MKKQKKIFILDTNVLLHDYKCIYNFEENDITSYRLTVQASKVIYSMGMLARLSLISKQLKEDE